FEFSYHLLPLFVHLPSLFRLLLELPAELGIGTGVQSELAPVQMGHFVRYGVEEPAIVGHYDISRIDAAQVLGEPSAGVQIQMVRRLVEKEQVVVGEQQLGEREAYLLAR